jgi:hypothetical protein
MGRIMVGNPEQRRPPGRHRRRWKDNIKIDIKVEWGGMDWIHLARDRGQWRGLVNMVIYL